ncbi:MAG: ACT domain-containing protein [Candidatus Micrarchaeota archaeon]
MGKSEISKVDSKGRLQIPSSFRQTLRIKEDSEVLVNLDEANQRLILTNATEKSLLMIIISMSDAPGSLARMAKVMAENGVDLVSTESRSISRGKEAEWQVICEPSSIQDKEKLKKKLLKEGAVKVNFKAI